MNGNVVRVCGQSCSGHERRGRRPRARRPPSLSGLYAKAVLAGALPGGDELPEQALVAAARSRSTASTSPSTTASAASRLCDGLPPTYPHILGFPLAMALMTERAFPFALLGMVHIEQPDRAAAPARRSTRPAAAARSGPRTCARTRAGASSTSSPRPSSTASVAWVERTTYLRPRQGRRRASRRSASEPPREVFAELSEVPGDIGRRYAAVSGDRNPIHMDALGGAAVRVPGGDRPRDVDEGPLPRRLRGPPASSAGRRGPLHGAAAAAGAGAAGGGGGRGGVALRALERGLGEAARDRQGRAALVAFSLSLNPAQLELVERTHRFAEDVIRPVAAEYDRGEEFPWPVLEKAAEEGFYNPLFYRDLISDPTGLSLPLFMEELFWGCAGIGLAIVMPALALSGFAQAATPEQLLRWAPECFGEPGDLKMAALAVTEPQGGSDVKNLQTCARRDGDEWVIDGHKMLIGNGGIADVHVVNATVDPELGHRGQALFIVPADAPGLRAGAQAGEARLPRVAHRRAPLRRLPGAGRPPAGRRREAGGEARLGAREGAEKGGRDGDRGSATLGTFEQTRPMVAAQALGIARAALEFASEYAAEREAFGEPIIEKQGVVVPARRAGGRARRGAAPDLAGVVDGGAADPVPHAEGSMSKLRASEVAVRATEHAVQVCGGWGYISDLPVEKWYRDAKLYTIFEGTSEIQRLVIGRALDEAAGEPPLHHRDADRGLGAGGADRPRLAAAGRGRPAGDARRPVGAAAADEAGDGLHQPAEAGAAQEERRVALAARPGAAPRRRPRAAVRARPVAATARAAAAALPAGVALPLGLPLHVAVLDRPAPAAARALLVQLDVGLEPVQVATDRALGESPAAARLLDQAVGLDVDRRPRSGSAGCSAGGR